MNCTGSYRQKRGERIRMATILESTELLLKSTKFKMKEESGNMKPR